MECDSLRASAKHTYWLVQMVIPGSAGPAFVRILRRTGCLALPGKRRVGRTVLGEPFPLWPSGCAEKKSRWLKIEVEVENERELESALKASPDWILLDNMSPAKMRRCVKLCRKRARLEASGGITLSNVERVARTGVDAISLGCLTHSAPAADLS